MSLPGTVHETDVVEHPLQDWRRLNLIPKLKSRIRNGEQFRKLIDLVRHPFHNLKFDDDLPL